MIEVPPLNFSVIVNAAAIADGAVTKKLYVDPPFVDVNIGTPAPLGPYVGTVKSVVNAVVGPTAFFTVIVHDMASFILTYVVPELI